MSELRFPADSEIAEDGRAAPSSQEKVEATSLRFQLELLYVHISCRLKYWYASVINIFAICAFDRRNTNVL